jgi:hypothetical protein
VENGFSAPNYSGRVALEHQPPPGSRAPWTEAIPGGLLRRTG